MSASRKRFENVDNRQATRSHSPGSTSCEESDIYSDCIDSDETYQKDKSFFPEINSRSLPGRNNIRYKSRNSKRDVSSIVISHDHHYINVRENRFPSHTVSTVGTSKNPTSTGVRGNQCKAKRVPKCFSKNAVMARMNRLKKKYYIDSLETDVNHLKKENCKLQLALNEETSCVTSLKKEIAYLRNILANSQELRLLLKFIRPSSDTTQQCPDLLNKGAQLVSFEDNTINETHLVSSFYDLSKNSPIINDFPLPMMEDIDSDAQFNSVNNLFEYDMPNVSFSYDSTLPTDLLDKDSPTSVGVCLHVSNKNVSLEFCSSCHESASTVWESFGNTSDLPP